MSREYDIYLQQHKDNVKKGFEWIKTYLPELLNCEMSIDDLEQQICCEHDASKSKLDEYLAYDKYFYGGNRSYQVVNDFNYAWLMHIHRNPHHWQYWLLNNDEPGEGMIVLDMPYNYLLEMICDWWAFSWSKEDLTEIFKWYDEHKDYMKLGAKTRKTVEDILEKIKKTLDNIYDLAHSDTNSDEEFDDYLAHYGVKGMKWGVRRTKEQLGHDRIFRRSNGGTYTSNDVVFISGKVKFDEPVPDVIKKELDRVISSKSKIIIGDAPGADTRVQDYLSKVGYKNVTVYTTDDKVRNNVGNWKVEKISGNGFDTEREVRRQKDIAMSNLSTKGIAISSDDDRADSATSLNIQRLIDSNKSVQFYDYKKDLLSENELTE